MKKLMFAAAAAMGLSAAFAIESANVVGYQQISAAQGSTMRCPTFKAVSGSTYKLIDIAVQGSDGIGDVCAQVIGKDGVWNGEYYYLDDGWYLDMIGIEPVDETVTLNLGDAIFLTSANNNLTLTVSGEVVSGQPVVPFSAGSGLVGNCTPVQIQFNMIEVVGSGGIGDVCAQTVGADGIWNGEYYYLDDGWYLDMIGIEAVDDTVVLAPGEAFYLYSETNDLTLKFPAVL